MKAGAERSDEKTVANINLFPRQLINLPLAFVIYSRCFPAGIQTGKCSTIIKIDDSYSFNN